MRELISLIFIIIGTAFVLVSALGVAKMPDLYLRMSSSTKTSTFGSAFILLGAVTFFIDEFGVASRTVAIILFLLLTAPVAAHLIGRAGYYTGVPLWQNSKYDDLKNKFDPTTNVVASSTESLDASLAGDTDNR